jgi:ubiquinone/menaquinone biosynthesis C-methylase UbiE
MGTISRHYTEFDEASRLDSPRGQLEFVRTQEIINRFLSPPPALVLDIGGATGVYARWLAQRHYRVHLIDLLPHHVAQAIQADKPQAMPVERFLVGDMRNLPYEDRSVDVVLALGPLYHLQKREERVLALKEGWRVLKPGGVLIAAAISRLASLIDGKIISEVDDPVFDDIVESDLAKGHHTNPTNHPDYFTDAYFHDPLTLKSELEDAGLRHKLTAAVEGPGFLLSDLDSRLSDTKRRAMLLEALRRIESETTAVAVTAHLLAVGTRP